MDLGTGHMAYTVAAQDARRAAPEREHRRVAAERAAELAADVAAADGSTAVTPVEPRRLRGFPVFSLFRSHRATAQ
jgi:arylamine N-acetyltransferase